MSAELIQQLRTKSEQLRMGIRTMQSLKLIQIAQRSVRGAIKMNVGTPSFERKKEKKEGFGISLRLTPGKG